MFPRPRYHNPGWWSREDLCGLERAARALARLIDSERRRGKRQDTRWQRPRPWRSRWSPEPRRFNSPPQDQPRRGLAPGRWLPGRNRGLSWRMDLQRHPPREVPPGGLSRALPRRGPPVAATRVPRWPGQGETCERQPRGVKPRGTLRGGPERSAEDPQRKPQGRLCGGPARSAKDPQLPHKNAKHVKAQSGRMGKQEAAERPTIIIVDEGGAERNWGPLSKANAWRAGSYLEDMNGQVLVFLEKDGTRMEVQAEKRIHGERSGSGSKKRANSPSRSSEVRATTTPVRRMWTTCMRTPLRRGGPNNWTR